MGYGRITRISERSAGLHPLDIHTAEFAVFHVRMNQSPACLTWHFIGSVGTRIR